MVSRPWRWFSDTGSGEAMRIANEDLLNGVLPDLVGSFNLRPVWLGHICNYSLQLVFTGSPVGTFKLQASNDHGMPDGGQTPQALNVSNWTDVTGSSQAVSAAGNIMWNVENAGYTFVRVVYTVTSGTGTLTSARANVKGV